MKRLFIVYILLLVVLSGKAIDLQNVRFHNFETDTARITNILLDVYRQKIENAGDRAVALGRKFLGTPYVGHTLEGDSEKLTINLDELDCTTFVETVVAMELTLRADRTSWLDYMYNLENVRYRGGEINGYPSRLHYIAAWGADNIHRGNFIEATTLFPKHTFMVKTLDFMSDNASKYQALSDSVCLDRIKEMERGFRNYRFPYIKTVDVGSKPDVTEFRNGDILAFVSNIKILIFPTWEYW